MVSQKQGDTFRKKALARRFKLRVVMITSGQLWREGAPLDFLNLLFTLKFCVNLKYIKLAVFCYRAKTFSLRMGPLLTLSYSP